MNLIGATTKTIKTYGKKNYERVVTINTWNYEVEEKLGHVNLLENIPNKNTAKKCSLKKNTFQIDKGSMAQRSTNVTNKNEEKEPVKRYTETKQRKTFTKGFTKPKHYRPLQKVTNHASEPSHIHDLGNSPKRLILNETMIERKTPSPTRLLNKTRAVYPSCQVVVTPLKDLKYINSEKENVIVSRNNIKIDSESQCLKKIEKHHLEIKPAKEHEYTDELTGLLNICDQKRLLTFEEFLGIDCLNNATKIGEASFSEVFTTYAPKFTSTKSKCVIKIIPFGRGKEILVNNEEQSSLKDITQEIKTTLELGGRTGLDPKLRVGFLKLYGVGVCRGKYPEVLLREWDRWDKEYKSESNRPDYFDNKQLYAVLIVEYGGLDLEHIKLKNWSQAWSILVQVGWSTAQAEQALKFEHRDLHWGNITIKPTKLKSISYDLLSANISVDVETFGVRAYIIDYTLSRMERGDEIIHVNIVDEGYFIGKGDYQFDIYRMMRKESKGDWKSFWPKTNVFWLHYIADKLLTAKKLNKPKKGSDQYDYYNAIMGFKKRALIKDGGYKSAMEAMNQDEAWRL